MAGKRGRRSTGSKSKKKAAAKPRQLSQKELRKQRQRIREEKEANYGRRLVANDSEGSFYEVEAILDAKGEKRKREYLIRWKGCGHQHDTWIPTMDLCDSLHEDAKKFDRMQRKKQKLEEKQVKEFLEREEREKSLEPGSMTMDVEDFTGYDEMVAAAEPQSQKDLLVGKSEEAAWIDKQRTKYLPLERIDARDPSAPAQVNNLRTCGIPFVLTNVLGWANFAKQWLGFPDDEENRKVLLDLAKVQQPLNIDAVIEAMIDDIGNEVVPIREKNNNNDGKLGKMSFRSFIKVGFRNQRYMHQWQFPESESGKSKLCGVRKSAPLPDHIFGENLLSFYYDGGEIVNPYQYIFMGDKDTESPLHNDPGGQDITIATIFGEKECILVHRNDEKYLYDLKAQPEYPDFDKYPLLAMARAYKTVISPGEILYMPEGTFHQCRNVTPCLSYSRYVLIHMILLLYLR
jgi:hypothetical protein